MNRTSVSWKTIRRQMIKEDPEFAVALEELAPEYEIARQLVKARLERGMTQEELAAKVGTRQSNISRIERGQQNTSIGLLNKVAKGLGMKLHVSIG
ncbi:MAG: helix-turn-helix transcriptional regulator [bacterium]|nr:helix-turn-helix transcriptional regulator [bacterium]